MKQLAFILRNKQNTVTVITFAQQGNLSRDLARTVFPDKDKAHAFAKHGTDKICDFTRLPVTDDQFTREHAEQLMQHTITVDSAAGFSNLAQDAAYLLSATVCDQYVIALQKTGDWMDEPVEAAWTPEITSLEQARKIQADFNDQHDVGGSTHGGGEIYRHGRFVGYLSYNGRLWDNAPWGGQTNNSIPALLDAQEA